jgi:hypothetical protein
MLFGVIPKLFNAIFIHSTFDTALFGWKEPSLYPAMIPMDFAVQT